MELADVMTESSSRSNQITLMLLTLFIILYFLFLWFPAYLPEFFFGESDLAYLVGHLLRMGVVVLLYLGYRRRVEDTPTTRVMPEEENRLHFGYIDLFVLALLYNIMPNVLDFVYSLFFDLSYNRPSMIEVNFYVDFIFYVFAAPVVEEIVFRWLFFKLVDRFDLGEYDFLGKMSLNVSIFALIHYGTNFSQVLQYSTYLISIPLWSMFGFFAFFIYYHTRSLKLTIIYHMMVNGFIMTVQWIDMIAEEQNSDFRIESWWLVVLFVILVVILYQDKVRSILELIFRNVFSKKALIFLFLDLLFNIIYWTVTYPFFYYLFDSNIYLLGMYMLIVFPLYSYGLIRVMQSETMISIDG